MPELNPEREAFALEFATMGHGSNAYRCAYGWNISQTAAGASAARLLRDDAMIARIAELRREVTAPVKEELYLTMGERRAFLAEIVRMPIGLIDANSRLCQSWKRIEGGDGARVECKMPDKLRAIELDAKLAGDFKEKIEHTVKAKPMTLAELDQRIRDANAREAEREAVRTGPWSPRVATPIGESGAEC